MDLRGIAAEVLSLCDRFELRQTATFRSALLAFTGGKAGH
jgi:hypothetical protein